jgi:hypothetical protein
VCAQNAQIQPGGKGGEIPGLGGFSLFGTLATLVHGSGSALHNAQGQAPQEARPRSTTKQIICLPSRASAEGPGPLSKPEAVSRHR